MDPTEPATGSAAASVTADADVVTLGATRQPNLTVTHETDVIGRYIQDFREHHRQSMLQRHPSLNKRRSSAVASDVPSSSDDYSDDGSYDGLDVARGTRAGSTKGDGVPQIKRRFSLNRSTSKNQRNLTITYSSNNIHSSQTELPTSPDSNKAALFTTSSDSFDTPLLLPPATTARGLLPPRGEVNESDELQTDNNFDGPRPRVGTFVSHTSSIKRKKKRWSISFLKKRFTDVGIDSIYYNYIKRIERLVLLRLLVLFISYNVILQILFNVVENDTRQTCKLWCNAFISFWTLLSCITVIPVYFSKLFRRSSTFVGVVVWLCVSARLFFSSPFAVAVFGRPPAPSANVPFVFFTVFVTYTMLPLDRPTSTVLGSITAVVDLVLSGTLTNVTGLPLVLQLAANGVIYICCNLTGLYHKHLTDLSHRHTFLDIRRFIEENLDMAQCRERQNAMKEALLLKIIPKHLLDDMKKIIYQKFVEVNRGPERVFHQLLIDRHKDVSILYADIVNFTQLTSSLEPSKLVRVLNELFGRFDQLAKKNNCLRIKMLGDCYYCVSGLPTPTETHARNCILMGMQMIKIIRKIRRQTNVENLDMRIGVHTGYVLCGVIGIKKWQYDIWSDDVTIANHMEAGGLSGCVHISEAVLRQLKGEFQVIPADGGSRDEYLRDNHIETFFIAQSEFDKVSIDDVYSDVSVSATLETDDMETHGVTPLNGANQVETPFRGLTVYNTELPAHDSEEVNRRLEAAFNIEHIKTLSDECGLLLQTCLKKAKGMNDDISREIQPMSLRFIDSELEMKFINKHDTTFKFCLVWAFVIYLFIVAVQVILLSRRSYLLISLVIGASVFSVQLILVTGLKSPLLACTSDQNTCRDKLGALSDIVTSRCKWRVTLATGSIVLIFLASILPVITHSQSGCKQVYANLTSILSSTDGHALTARRVQDDSCQYCLFAPYYVYSCAATLMSCSVFIRLHNGAKTTFKLIILVVFNTMFFTLFEDVFHLYDLVASYLFIPANIHGFLYTLLLAVSLFMLDRQLERNFRLNFLCKHKTRLEHQEVLRNDMMNEFLLFNILPKHVADHFLSPDRSPLELYHTICPRACVMFAAIPNFKAFFSEVNVTGNECLRLLNEIIVSFDKVLLMQQFQGLEKMKTIGSTYMAAGGLQQGSADLTQDDQWKTNLVLITKFALAIQSQLEQISRDAFYEYKLRIGISHGKVIAGVIGATMPQFDIWGDAVNVASRMESHGVIGRIQVDDVTARLLINAGIECDSRGQIMVKGKGLMNVYLVSDKYAALADSGTSDVCS